MFTKEDIEKLEKIGMIKRVISNNKEEIYLRRFCGNHPTTPIWWQKICESPLNN